MQCVQANTPQTQDHQDHLWISLECFFPKIYHTKFRHKAWVLPAEHGKWAWLCPWILCSVLTPLLHTLARPPHSQAWCCRLALTSGLRWPSQLIWMGMVWIPHLMAGAETLQRSGDVWLHRACTVTSTASVCACKAHCSTSCAKHLRRNESSLPSTTPTIKNPIFAT